MLSKYLPVTITIYWKWLNDTFSFMSTNVIAHCGAVVQFKADTVAEIPRVCYGQVGMFWK